MNIQKLKQLINKVEDYLIKVKRGLKNLEEDGINPLKKSCYQDMKNLKLEDAADKINELVYEVNKLKSRLAQELDRE